MTRGRANFGNLATNFKALCLIFDKRGLTMTMLRIKISNVAMAQEGIFFPFDKLEKFLEDYSKVELNEESLKLLAYTDFILNVNESLGELELNF